MSMTCVENKHVAIAEIAAVILNGVQYLEDKHVVVTSGFGIHLLQPT